MFGIFKKMWQSYKEHCERKVREREEYRQIVRDNIETWNRMNKRFCKQMDREVAKEIDERYDVAKRKTVIGHRYCDFTAIK